MIKLTFKLNLCEIPLCKKPKQKPPSAQEIEEYMDSTIGNLTRDILALTDVAIKNFEKCLTQMQFLSLAFTRGLTFRSLILAFVEGFRTICQNASVSSSGVNSLSIYDSESKIVRAYCIAKDFILRNLEKLGAKSVILRVFYFLVVLFNKRLIPNVWLIALYLALNLMMLLKESLITPAVQRIKQNLGYAIILDLFYWAIRLICLGVSMRGLEHDLTCCEFLPEQVLTFTQLQLFVAMYTASYLDPVLSLLFHVLGVLISLFEWNVQNLLYDLIVLLIPFKRLVYRFESSERLFGLYQVVGYLVNLDIHKLDFDRGILNKGIVSFLDSLPLSGTYFSLFVIEIHKAITEGQQMLRTFGIQFLIKQLSKEVIRIYSPISSRMGLPSYYSQNEYFKVINTVAQSLNFFTVLVLSKKISLSRWNPLVILLRILIRNYIPPYYVLFLDFCRASSETQYSSPKSIVVKTKIPFKLNVKE